MIIQANDIRFFTVDATADNGSDFVLKAGDGDGTDKNGGNIYLRTGRSTGSGSGYIFFEVTQYAGSGSTPNELANVGYVEYAGVVLEYPSDTHHMTYRTMRYRDGATDLQNDDVTGEIRFTGQVNSGVESQGAILGRYIGDGTSTEGAIDFTVNEGGSTNTKLFSIRPDRIETYAPIAYNGSLVGGEVTIRDKSLNIGSTTDIAAFGIQDGQNCIVRVEITILQDDGGTNNTSTFVTYDLIAISSPTGTITVDNGSYIDIGVGVDFANLAISADFIPDEANNKVTLRIDHGFTGGYTPTSVKANFIIKKLTENGMAIL